MGGNLDVHSLSEGHQFIILLLVQVAQLATTFLLYRSSPIHKKASDANSVSSVTVASSGPNIPGQ